MSNLRQGRIRGLSDIRTHGSLRGGRAPEKPRVWVFVSRPSFERLQGVLGVERVAEPRLDLMVEDSGLLVLVDLPGVEEDHIEVHVHGDVLAVETRPGPSGRFYHEVLLPFLVADEARQKFNNGVLQIELDRLREPSLDERESHNES